jgi:iron complex outermembrane receptor protein
MKGYQEVAELVAGRQPFLVGPTAGTILSRQRRFVDAQTEDLIGRAEITGHFDIAGMANTLVVGVDYDYFKFTSYQTRYRPPSGAATADFSNPAVMATYNAINALNPVYGAYPLADASVSFVYNRLEKDFAWGSYFYDQIDLMPWLKVRVGGRYDEFRQHYFTYNAAGAMNTPLFQNVSKFSPQGGVVIQPIEVRSPSTARTAKASDRIMALMSETTRSNRKLRILRNRCQVRLGGQENQCHARLVHHVEDQHSDIGPGQCRLCHRGWRSPIQGLEFDVNARLPHQFNLIASYAYTDAYWTANFSDPDFAQPIRAGDPLIGVSKNSGNLLLTGDFDLAEDRKATIGGGVQYIDRRLGETAANYYLPSATLFRVLGSIDLTTRLRAQRKHRKPVQCSLVCQQLFGALDLPGFAPQFLCSREL